MPFASEAMSILEQMNSRGIEQTLPSCPSAFSVPRRVLAVLAGSAQEVRRAAVELSVLLRLGCSLDVVAPVDVRAFRGLLSKCNFYASSENMPDGFLDGADCLVAVLDRGSAAKICLGLQDDMGSRVFLEALWRKLDVYADLSGLSKPQTGNEVLKALYEGYAATVARLGVSGIERGSYVPVILKRLGIGNRNRLDPASSDAPTPVSGQRFVVTGKDVRERDAGTEWRLPYGTIVTDVARETAKRMGIELILHPCAGEGVARHADG